MNLLQFTVLVLLHHHVSAEGEICGAETERPRDLACLRKLWREAGCYPYGTMAPDNSDVRPWYGQGISDVRKDMAERSGVECYGKQYKNVPPVSIGNPASQSSTVHHYAATIASRAESNCYLPQHQTPFTHTENYPPRWWAVDLKNYILVDTVRIIARNRLDYYVGSYGIYVLQGENDIDNDASRCSRSTVGDTALTCDVRREGTHVRLLREDTKEEPLCLCKLIVYGYPSCGPDAKAGPHSMACLRKLWNGIGCDVTGTSSPDNINVHDWNAMNVDKVKANMASLSGDRCRNSSFNISDLDAVSIGKPATQSSRALSSGDEHRADLASVAKNNCYDNTLSPNKQTLTASELMPWWNLDLEAYYRVRFVRIIARRDGSDDWLGTYNVTVGHPSWVTSVASVCQKEITGNDVMIHCQGGPIGANIRIQRTETGNTSLALCKVIVYGKKACPVGKFSWPMCRETCPVNCKGSLCSLNTGDCVGCVAGKRGPKCQEDCSDDTWGENCKKNCSVGCRATCDKVNGCCSCSEYFYGSLCQETCSQNCKNICDKSTGFCQCKPGYQLQKCTQVCDQGWYGHGCTQQCSAGCTSPCNHVNGTCSCRKGHYLERCDGQCAPGCQGGCEQTTGNCQCRPGYISMNCSSKCIGGTYGQNCLSNCSVFCSDPGVCNHVTGFCSCQIGFSGDTCNEVCSQGWYGDGCRKQCSAGCISPCNHVTGTCSCQEGYYLKRCDGRCAQGCQSGCQQKTGYCQCRPGYTDLNCTSECPGGTFGKDCLSACSVYCKDRDVCDHVTGRCTCKDGYSGERCDTATAPLGAIIGGTIGGVSFLVLVVLLAIILFRKDFLSGFGAKSKGRKQQPIKQHELSNVLTPRVSHDAGQAEAEIPAYEQHVPEEAVYENAGVSVSEFPVYFKSMKEKESGFEDEFKALPTPQVTGQLGNRLSLREKNRFKNVVPYDWSRVRLSRRDEDPSSEYINASYIPGYNTDKAVIAAQGPTEHSVDDFVRMIWEHHVPLVVMVTKLSENRKTKCERYLPVMKSDSLTLGHVTIRLTQEDVTPHYVSRTLTLKKDGETRVLRHLQFLSWPDHGVPTSPAAFINFHQMARKLYQPDVGPTVVHCSAGVGRTGTFLVMDYLLQQAEAEGRLDVFNCVKTMREARVSMVQSLDQYVFIHEALLEALHCGQCTVPAAMYVTWWALDDVSAIKRQFQVLGMMASPLKPSDTSDAQKEENVSKNRPGVPLPANRWRPILMTPAPGCNDYINAIFVHSYERKHAFIVTQDPMENTGVDFWRLVQDYGCTMVVSLNFDQRSPLWYTEDSLTLGPYKISRHSVKELDYYSQRKIYWKNSDTNVRGTVEHLLLIGDPEGLPRTGAILAMLDEVKRGLQQSEEDRVLIHCRNGCEIAGLVLALHHICEKISGEQEVDVFHAVKNIRESRSQFISTSEEYLWLHQAAADYINQYSTYANFR